MQTTEKILKDFWSTWPWKNPQGKNQWRKFIMEFLRKNYSRNYKPTHLKLAASSSLEIVPASSLEICTLCLGFQHWISCMCCCTVPWNPCPPVAVNAPRLVCPLPLSKCALLLLGVPSSFNKCALSPWVSAPSSPSTSAPSFSLN